MYCDDCLRLPEDPNFLTKDFQRIFKSSFAECERAAASGCPLCSIVDSSFQKGNLWPRSEIGNGPITMYHSEHGSASQVTIEVPAASSSEKILMEISTDSDDPAASDPRIIARNVNTESGNKSCIERITHILELCKTTHPKCGSIAGDSHLPSRVLDLESSEEGAYIRLLATNRAIKGDYVTLSHCWGPPTSRRMVLTTENLPDLQHEINIVKLTPVFQDAVTLTRALGIRYLWIDALCIIQNSKSDWAEESARMATIYQNATLNIASACSPDSQTRFLRPRSIRTLDKIPFQSRNMQEQGGICLRRICQYMSVMQNHLAEPLQSRAWCFQERILSRRTVFFDSDMFIWECHEGHIPENSSLPENMGLYTSGKRSMLPYTKPRQHIRHDTIPQDTKSVWADLANHWYQMLYEFGLRKLTYLDDILPAMSGIAKHYSAITKDTYLAGIWQSDLHRGLLWRISDIDEKDAVRNLGGPSWSWASLLKNSGGFEPCAVNYSYHHRRESTRDVQLLSTQMVPLYGDPTGAMLSAQLELQGLTRQVHFEYMSGHRIDNRFAPFHQMSFDQPTHGIDVVGSFDPDWVIEQWNESNKLSKGEPIDVEFTALFISEWVVSHRHTNAFLYGLLLIPAGKQKNTYVRKGIFKVSPPLLGSEELAYMKANSSSPYGVDPRKITFDETWEGWEERTVLII